jgi:hypothetical protein
MTVTVVEGPVEEILSVKNVWGPAPDAMAITMRLREPKTSAKVIRTFLFAMIGSSSDINL